MRIGVVAKADEPRRVKVAGVVVSSLRSRAEVVVTPELHSRLQMEGVVGEPVDSMKVDVIVVVGGDGTILWTLQQNPAPVFGINVGELGFLTEVEPIDLPDALDRLLSGDYFLESRLRLSPTLSGKRLPWATNEVVVKSKRASKLLALGIRWGENETLDVRADGLIFSTPTGSTSYAMSAGGPIVDPRVEAIIVVPLAAFSLSSRPIVLPSSVEVEVRLGHPDKEALVVVDGQAEVEMSPEEVLRIALAPERAKFIRFRNQFFPRLRERLG